MKGLIIAAGDGTRMGELTQERPKPLISILGKPLIERIILAAKKAGIRSFVVVTGYLGEKIRRRLGNGRKLGVKIRYVSNPEWERENGLSVLKAKKLLGKENFILMMSDHLFEPKIIKKLKRIRIRDGCVLAVDKSPEYYIDLDDATKVVTRNGKILRIGKDLKRFNAVDCGIFLCTPRIFDALENSIERGDETLSGGIRLLARQGKMRAMDIGDAFWMDIDTPWDCEKAEDILTGTFRGPECQLIYKNYGFLGPWW
ncbi:MAG: nucleotidyltransferase [Candidatus Aenigmatarchaeota archaeon]|nr:MAG: nucleotidyltransferase [Candidatus Aenigmarchaeota archaeon]